MGGAVAVGKVSSKVQSIHKGISIHSFLGAIAALGGARNPHVPEVRCGCCAPAVPECVYVAICVPKSCCGPKVTCRDGGRYVKYDYGKYRVEIRVKGEKVVVDYDN